MTRLIAQELDKREIGFEYLYGGVPSAKRKDLVDNFMNEPSSRVFRTEGREDWRDHYQNTSGKP